MIKFDADGPTDRKNCVLLCCDTNYEKFAFSLIKQIVEAYPDLDADICLVAEHKIEPPPSLQDIPVRLGRMQVDLKDINFPKNRHVNFSAYLRLFAVTSLCDYYDRVLYLDSDIFLLNDGLPGIFDITLLPGHAVGAVRDIPQQLHLSTVPKDAIALNVPFFPYFNSGVLLVDCHKWIKEDVFGKALEAVREYGHAFTYNDQSALNIALRGDWSELSWHWNWIYDARRIHQIYFRDPVFVHFAGAEKPWFAMKPYHQHRFIRWYEEFLATHYQEPLHPPRGLSFAEEKMTFVRYVKKKTRFLSLLKHNIRSHRRFKRYDRRFRTVYEAIDPWS